MGCNTSIPLAEIYDYIRLRLGNDFIETQNGAGRDLSLNGSLTLSTSVIDDLCVQLRTCLEDAEDFVNGVALVADELQVTMKSGNVFTADLSQYNNAEVTAQELEGNTLVTTLSDGQVFRTDLTQFVDTGVEDLDLNGNELVITMLNGETHTVNLERYLDTDTSITSFERNGDILTITESGGDSFDVDLAKYLDNAVQSFTRDGSTLTITMGNAESFTVDLAAILQAERYVEDFDLSSDNLLTITMANGETHTVDLTKYLDTDVSVQSFNRDGDNVVLTLTNGTNFTIGADAFGQSVSASVDRFELVETTETTPVIEGADQVRDRQFIELELSDGTLFRLDAQNIVPGTTIQGGSVSFGTQTLVLDRLSPDLPNIEIDLSTIGERVQDITFDPATGLLTLELSDGQSVSTTIESSGNPVESASLDPATNVLTLTLSDGTVVTADLAALGQQVEGITFDPATGLLTVELSDGQSVSTTIETSGNPVESATLDAATSVLTLTLSDGTIVTADLSALAAAEDEFVETVSFDPATNTLTLGRARGADLTTSLAGAGRPNLASGALSGTDLVLNRSDGSQVTVSLTALAADIYASSLSLSSATGVLTVARVGAASLTVNLTPIIPQPVSSIFDNGAKRYITKEALSQILRVQNGVAVVGYVNSFPSDAARASILAGGYSGSNQAAFGSGIAHVGSIDPAQGWSSADIGAGTITGVSMGLITSPFDSNGIKLGLSRNDAGNPGRPLFTNSFVAGDIDGYSEITESVIFHQNLNAGGLDQELQYDYTDAIVIDYARQGQTSYTPIRAYRGNDDNKLKERVVHIGNDAGTLPAEIPGVDLSRQIAIGDTAASGVAGNRYVVVGDRSGKASNLNDSVIVGHDSIQRSNNKDFVAVGHNITNSIPTQVTGPFAFTQQTNLLVTVNYPAHGVPVNQVESVLYGPANPDQEAWIYRVDDNTLGLLYTFGLPVNLNGEMYFRRETTRNLVNRIAIGSRASLPASSNTMVLGSNALTRVETFGAYYGADFITTSDERIKTDIVEQLTLSNGIKVYEFKWLSDGRTAVGWVAQQVRQLLVDAGYSESIIDYCITKSAGVDLVSTIAAANTWFAENGYTGVSTYNELTERLFDLRKAEEAENLAAQEDAQAELDAAYDQEVADAQAAADAQATEENPNPEPEAVERPYGADLKVGRISESMFDVVIPDQLGINKDAVRDLLG